MDNMRLHSSLFSLRNTARLAPRIQRSPKAAVRQPEGKTQNKSPGGKPRRVFAQRIPRSSLRGSLLIGILLLILMPFAVWVETTDKQLWNERLFLPQLEEEPNRHTPIHVEGTFLPPSITTNRIFGIQDNPIILASTTRVPSGVTLTFTEGADVYAHEYAQLIVEGSLIINGSEKGPVEFTTNEQHVQNRVWAGIIFSPESSGLLSYVHIRHASPAVSCLERSNVTMKNATVELANLGVFSQSDACSVTDSLITAVDDGIISIGPKPLLTNTSIHAKNEEVKEYK